MIYTNPAIFLRKEQEDIEAAEEAKKKTGEYPYSSEIDIPEYKEMQHSLHEINKLSIASSPYAVAIIKFISIIISILIGIYFIVYNTPVSVISVLWGMFLCIGFIFTLIRINYIKNLKYSPGSIKRSGLQIKTGIFSFIENVSFFCFFSALISMIIKFILILL